MEGSFLLADEASVISYMAYAAYAPNFCYAESPRGHNHYALLHGRFHHQHHHQHQHQNQHHHSHRHR